MEFNIDHIERVHLLRRAHDRASFSDDRVPAFEREAGVQRPQPLIQRSLPGRCQCECVPGDPVEGPEDFVYVLAVLAEDVDRPVECLTVEEIVDAFSLIAHDLDDSLLDTIPRIRNIFKEFTPVGNHHFRGSGGSGGPDIGDEIGYRVVGFMTDRAHDGDAAPGYCASDDLFVERPEVFQGSSPASHDDEVDFAEPAEVVDRCCDLCGRAVPLHTNRDEYQFDPGESPAKDVLHVLQHRSGR
jgi:hypothetical protein